MSRKVPNILIVDDDVKICAAIGLILREKGWTTEVAHTGKEAIRKSEEAAFNVALLDISLPDIEGTKLLNLLHETTPRMVKIIVTGHPALKNAVEALNDGADAYLTKPVRPEDLLTTIGTKFEEQQQAERMTEEKIAFFLETRAKKLLAHAEDDSTRAMSDGGVRTLRD